MTRFDAAFDLHASRLGLVALKKDRRSLTPARLDAALDLEAAGNRLVMVVAFAELSGAAIGVVLASGFDIGFDLEAAGNRLVMVVAAAKESGFDIGFDFHTCLSPFGC